MKIVKVEGSGRLRCEDDEDENLWVGGWSWLIETLCQQDPTVEERLRDRGLKVKMIIEILDD